ncbi:hypothetical protein J6590_047064 [Homalodisca vitripennis]|nr:hypothetical protein J6590_047064 [Homalodisca vitripennis]
MTFTFHLVQRLECDAVSDSTPGVWSHVRVKRYYKMSMQPQLACYAIHGVPYAYLVLLLKHNFFTTEKNKTIQNPHCDTDHSALRRLYLLQFTFLLVQSLKSDAVTDLTPGIWSHNRVKRSKRSWRRRRSK